MRISILGCRVSTLAIFLISSNVFASGLPVVANHPRIFLTPAIKNDLIAKQNANDPRWIKLKDRADALKTYTIMPYKYATRTTEAANTIFYDYQGEGWWSSAMPLAFAYQMTNDKSYSDKLLALVDEMIRAQTDPDNMYPNGAGPLVPDNYYATRNICPVLAIAYDWCYDQLGATRKAAMLSLMNAYYVELHDSAYQRNSRADGNYYIGHLFGTAMMGYATYGDNAKAQEMIDWARIRFDGTPSALIDADHTPEDFFAQLFEGGAKPQVAREYNGPDIKTAPFKGGVHLQGWAYGTASYIWITDYMLVVKTATGEDLIATHRSWLSQIFRALKHALMPNRFEIDPNGDFGGNYGAVISRSLPVRLAFTLAGTPDGPGAQHFAYDEIVKTSPLADFPEFAYQEVYQQNEWEDFYFTDMGRPSTELAEPPYHTGFAPVYPLAGPTNGALPYFVMRSDWGPTATWASIHAGSAWYDDHMHTDAGHIQIKHADDYLVIDAANWKGDTGSIGIIGSSQNSQYDAGAAANTLFFDDYGDYQYSDIQEPGFAGGQGGWGHDELIAAEMTNNYTYIRSDLSTAYNHGGDTTDPAVRKLEYFYRSFAYIRPANIFVVYDQTKALASSNPRGEYRKHIRWHFPDRPVITGSTLTMQQRASRVNMAFLLPENPAIGLVDENHNPDPCDGGPGCMPYDFNSGTFRVEVRDPAASRTTPFLTVLQPTFAADPAMTASKVNAVGDAMIGTRVSVPGKGTYVMMFNNGAGQVPTPLSGVSYSVAGAPGALHTLGGMKPSTKYVVTLADPQVTVTENSSGNFTSSEAGVLQFGAVNAVGASQSTSDLLLATNYPNPFQKSTTISFVLPERQHVTIVLNDAVGKLVKTLVNATLNEGENAIELESDGLPNGVYSYTIQAGNVIATRECVVLK